MTMRRMIIINLILTLLFTAMAFAQQEAKDGEKAFTLQKLPSSLEEMLGRALKSNPDIQVAEADLHQAQTRLNQVRLHVSQILVEVFQARRACIEGLQIAKEKHDQMQKKVDAGLVHQELMYELRQDVTMKEVGLAEVESSIRRHVGIDPVNGKTPESLEKGLAQAFQTNGDVALARADLVRADAILNQARLKVTEEVTINFQERRSRQHAVNMHKKALEKAQEQWKESCLGNIQTVIEAETALNKVEARLRYLLGLGGSFKTSK